MKTPIKTPINQAQMMVLQVVKNQYDEQDLSELRELLLAFNHRKMQKNLDATLNDKQYTDQDFEKILKGHDRKTR